MHDTHPASSIDVEELWEEVENRVNSQRAEVLPEEDCLIADLRPQILEHHFQAVAGSVFLKRLLSI